VVHHENAAHAKAAAEAACDEVARLHQLWSPYEKSSTIAHMNAAQGRAVRVDADTLGLLVSCRRLWEETKGLFDPTVGALMKWWGFRGEPELSGRALGAPRPAWGMGHVEIDEAAGTVRLALPSIELDLGAIGKGAALDAAGRVLREAGIESALLHAGTSSVLAIGTPPGNPQGWRVRVGDRADSPEVVLRDESLSVSSMTGQTVASSDGEVSHVLDPRTGAPMTRTVPVGKNPAALAAVVCHDGVTAEAWSTAALITGEPPPRSIARWARVP
jgi:FAD:protein FMN transferase